MEQAGDAVAVTVDTGYGPTAAVTLWARVDPGVNNVTHAWPPDGPLVRLPVTEDLTAAVEHLRDTATGLAVVGRIVAWFDSDPPLPADSGYGEHGGASGRPDWRARGLARVGEPLAAVAGRLGIGNAAALLRHYLGNSGADYVVDPDQLVQDVVVLGNEVEVAVRRELEQVAVYAGDNDAYERPLPLDTGWRRIAMSDLSRLDWKLALGSFYYRVTGTATVRPAVEGGRPTVDMDYRIHVFDHYFWTRGGSLPVGSLQIPVDALGELHRQGVAHEFRVRGSTELRRYTGELPLPAQGPAVTGNPQLAATGYEPGSITQALAPVPITGQYSPGAQAGGSEQPGR